MKYDWFDEYCLEKKGASKDFKEEWQWERYLICGKMFAAICGDNGENKLFTLKCEPAVGLMLREKYEDIIPGYYMNKVHWNSVKISGIVPDEVIKQMIDMSYSLVLGSMTKKAQKEINDAN